MDWIDDLVNLMPSDEKRPEPTQWNGDDLRPMPSADEDDDTDARRQDAYHLMTSARDFAGKYGLHKMLMCIADAFNNQHNLFR